MHVDNPRLDGAADKRRRNFGGAARLTGKKRKTRRLQQEQQRGKGICSREIYPRLEDKML